MYIKRTKSGVHEDSDKVFYCPRCKRYIALGYAAPKTVRCKGCAQWMVGVKIHK